MTSPVLFLDFDNTITEGDLLDAILERFSRDDTWRAWETAWQKGAISTVECLQRQMANVKPLRAEILEFAAATEIDPYFKPLVRCAAAAGIEVIVLSDNFTVLIDAVFDRHALPRLPVLANELTFLPERIEVGFPHRDPACPRCAHCKGRDVRAVRGRTTIFAGDGYSDICAALAADTVFAKDSLARYLSAQNRTYRPFDSLAEVLDFVNEGTR